MTGVNYSEEDGGPDMEYRDYKLRLWVDTKCFADSDLETMLEKLPAIYEAYTERKKCHAGHPFAAPCSAVDGAT